MFEMGGVGMSVRHAVGGVRCKHDLRGLHVRAGGALDPMGACLSPALREIAQQPGICTINMRGSVMPGWIGLWRCATAALPTSSVCSRVE